jgi:hypothetical protein
MSPQDLTGAYTYRSFLNQPEPAPDFDSLRFGEAELSIAVAQDGSVTGTLAFPADPEASDRAFMDMTGRATDGSPPTLELEGLGRTGTGTADFDYKYVAYPAPAFSDAVDQRPTLVGTVMRAKPHGGAPAGVTASLIAVRRGDAS